ncbi:hypothetical protein G647_00453 [Cladophialophora carrionii CBS 160.54]|uniref:Uncharacterized protein n=1 Tax=Cladophialophora carrionii CBS 160.54 TaxID=1279043 RepID=V9DM73_9EURO|nr:uncharacterized protein G647_00453 [Cladophialophora carrionii CBS 160.54]ETI28004.1 hypothetical protein G647_00453 [Cladophialophora carrionii CBS 160.54]
MSLCWRKCVIDRSDPHRPRDYGVNSAWRPTNLVKRLPASLEHLKVKGYVFRWGVDLDGLVDDLLGTTGTVGTQAQHSAQGRGKGNLTSLRRLKLVTTPQDHCRPFDKDAQARDDRLRRGIDRLMTALPVQEIKCTQSHRLTQSSRSCDEEYFIRKLCARRSVTAPAEIDKSDAGMYNVEEQSRDVVVKLEAL